MMSANHHHTSRYWVGGNWKLNGTKESIEALVKTYNEGPEIPDSVEVVAAPTALHIGYVMDNIRKDIAVSAQNVSSEEGFGAATGELSADLFKAWGVQWTLTGHSERRRRKQIRSLGHDEVPESVARKTKHALDIGMSVCVCIGETLADREAGKTIEVCETQLEAVNAAISRDQWERVVIAYEPVWAIGTGVAASPEQAQEVHAALRKWITHNVSLEVAMALRIVYGGSVNGEKAPALIAKEDIDGFLVGGAALKADIHTIIQAIPKEKKCHQEVKKSFERRPSLNADGSSTVTKRQRAD